MAVFDEQQPRWLSDAEVAEILHPFVVLTSSAGRAVQAAAAHRSDGRERAMQRKCRRIRHSQRGICPGVALATWLAWGMAVPGPTTQRYIERLAGNLLRLARAQRGWSQRQLAEAAGVPVSTVARIESGARQPSLVTLSRLLVAADFELRTRLEAYDDHDDVLDASLQAMTPEQQAQQAVTFERTSQVLAESRRTAPTAP